MRRGLEATGGVTRAGDGRARSRGRLEAARSLNVRTLAAHTGVSTDGKMLISSVLPLNWSLVTAPRSVPTRVKAGAELPTAGSSPTVLMGFPLMVICAMATSLSKTGALGCHRGR